MKSTRIRTPSSENAFHERMILPEEERRWIRKWEGSYRWFRSPNVVPLERYRGSTEMARIRRMLLAR